MKTLLSALVALGLLAGAANAATPVQVQADNSLTEWCNDYYKGH